MRISQQRHMEEILQMNAHPQIRHHCAITDRLDKGDSRYVDFTEQVKNNECRFEADNGTLNDKHDIALKMNAHRSSALGTKSNHCSRDSLSESFVQTDRDCVEGTSDEETNSNLNNCNNGTLEPSGYASSPSVDSCVSNDDTLPPCNPGVNTSLVIGSERSGSARPITCLSLLRDWSGETNESDSDETSDLHHNNEQTFEVNYAWINSELEKIETVRNEKKKETQRIASTKKC